jgi:hypothetical protein
MDPLAGRCFLEVEGQDRGSSPRQPEAEVEHQLQVSKKGHSPPLDSSAHPLGNTGPSRNLEKCDGAHGSRSSSSEVAE